MADHYFLHIEIPATDYEAMERFYSTSFGWEMKVYEEFDYHEFEAEPGPPGAFVLADSPIPSFEMGTYKVGQPLLYIHSEDIDGDLLKVEEFGGKVVSPKAEISGVGWFAIFEDPSGNRLALMNYNTS